MEIYDSGKVDLLVALLVLREAQRNLGAKLGVPVLLRFYLKRKAQIFCDRLMRVQHVGPVTAPI